MYDIWLAQAINGETLLGDMIRTDPEGIPTEVYQRIQEKSLGFLGLNVPEVTARQILRTMGAHGARGLIVRSQYRVPIVARSQALVIADNFIQQDKRQRFPEYSLSQTEFLSEHAMWWKFWAYVKEFEEADLIPSGLFACVDKLDGHVWDPDSMERTLESAKVTA
jgi:hypothetical protein